MLELIHRTKIRPAESVAALDYMKTDLDRALTSYPFSLQSAAHHKVLRKAPVTAVWTRTCSQGYPREDRWVGRRDAHPRRNTPPYTHVDVRNNISVTAGSEGVRG